jgi:hypothetical protein
MAHRQAAQDFGEGLLRPASYHQEEVRGQDFLGQQTHGSPHIHWRYAKRSQEKPEVMEFFFCNDDIVCCVKGTKRKWVQSRLDIPSIWPLKIGTNLSKKEILDFESVGFQLPQRAVISLRRLFGTEELPFNLASFPTPASADDYPKTRSGKSIAGTTMPPTRSRPTTVCPLSP